VLLLAAGGAVTAGVVEMLPWPAAVAAALGLLLSALTPYAAFVAPVAGLVLLGSGLTTTATPPLVAGVLLVLLLLGIATRAPRQQELDASLVAATGLAVIGASTGIGWSPAVPLAGCTALLVTAIWHRQRAAAGHAPRRAQRAIPRSLLVATAVTGALAMLALPTTSAVGLGSSLFGRHGHSGGNGTQVDPSSSSTDTLNLSVRGQLSTNPVLDVSADAPDLWRGDVYATYTGSTWLVPQSSAGLDPRPPGATVQLTATPLGPGYDGTLYAPGVVRAVTASAPLVHHSPGGAAFTDPVPYHVSVVLPVTSSARLAAATGPDPAGWTALPRELPQRVRDLAAQLTANATTRPAKVAAVETYLRTHERYTLTAPVPPTGHDAVDDMLFRTHEGFCEQFASAEVVLLRSVGIPARLATGFAYGDVTGDTRMFTDADAHAWVEVSYPGLGWSTSDPTAGVPLATPGSSVLSRVRSALSWIGRTPERRAGAAGILAVLLLVGVLGTGRLRRVRVRRRTAAGPVSLAFARLERRVPRRPGATPREYARTVPADLDAAVLAWEAELFGAVRPPPAESRAAVRTVRRAARRRRGTTGRGATSPRSPGRP
jgi:transglutaminase-like putative cysteine protease